MGSASGFNAGLRHLTGLSSLMSLALGECKGVTNAGMVHVARLTALEHLALQRTAVTNDGLLQLTGLTKLTTLGLPQGFEIMKTLTKTGD
ncbi:unnamed protein product [Closterium sp. NIES-53]